jgi:hypothetical protein
MQEHNFKQVNKSRPEFGTIFTNIFALAAFILLQIRKYRHDKLFKNVEFNVMLKFLFLAVFAICGLNKSVNAQTTPAKPKIINNSPKGKPASSPDESEPYPVTKAGNPDMRYKINWDKKKKSKK